MNTNSVSLIHVQPLCILCTDTEEEEEVYLASQLGGAVLASALSPDEGLTVFAEMQQARRCFVLESDLHLVYLVCSLPSARMLYALLKDVAHTRFWLLSDDVGLDLLFPALSEEGGEPKLMLCLCVHLSVRR